MAPTEILAQQHYHNLAPLLERLGMRVALLTGSLSVKKKESLKAALAAGELDLCIGTHAILTADTEFSRLGLVITDEQHRFGVQQRAALRQKGQDTHVLVMSATPIPRTLAMIVYGDLELSIIDELPAGRQPVRTYLINSEIRERAFGYIRRHLDAGYQAYLICPAVQSEEEEAAAERRGAEKKKRAMAKMLITSGFSFDGYTITKYSGYISGDDAISVDRGLAVFGSDTGVKDKLLNSLVEIRRNALRELKEAAYELGCNAVIGVDFDYITLDPQTKDLLATGGISYQPYVFAVTANGNAVVIEKNGEDGSSEERL